MNQLMIRLGYGGIERETDHHSDQAIDGIINQDPLGLEKIYVQAKRCAETQVGEQEIRGFSGSLEAKGAAKGVIITTATFSKTARDTAENISRGNQHIILIDGPALVKLMFRHGVGVVTQSTYEVKQLDVNYFAEL